MKVKQKYIRGNLVKIIGGSRHLNDLAIIEDFSNPQGEMKEYSLTILKDGNSIAWIYEDNLEFVEEGGEYLFEQAKENRELKCKKEMDLKFIKDNFNNGFKEGLTSTTILFLFGKIGFDSSFSRNGEFYILFSNWEQREDIFKHLFKGDRESMKAEINKFYKAQYRDKYLKNFNELFDEVEKL